MLRPVVAPLAPPRAVACVAITFMSAACSFIFDPERRDGVVRCDSAADCPEPEDNRWAQECMLSEDIDLEGIAADNRTLHIVDMGDDAGPVEGLADPEEPRVGCDLHDVGGVVAELHRCGLHVADLEVVALFVRPDRALPLDLLAPKLPEGCAAGTRLFEE